MKKLVSLAAVTLLAGCAATPFTFDGDNASKGFVVMSTGLDAACVDEFDNTFIEIKDAKTQEYGRRMIVDNLFMSPDFEENSAHVYSFPMEAGDYVIDQVATPNKLLAYITDRYPTTRQTFTVTAGQVQYIGAFHFQPVNGACSKEQQVLKKLDFKARDMKKAAEDQPALFSQL